MSDTDPATPGDAIRSLVAATRATTKARRERDEAEAKLALIRRFVDQGITNDDNGYRNGAAEALHAIAASLMDPKP